MKSSRIAAAMLSVIVLVAATAGMARADQVDSPRYKAWASFKVGSSETYSGTVQAGSMQMTIEVKNTLKEVADDHVTIESVSTVTVAGQQHQAPAVSKTINAKEDSDNIKEAGEEDVQAMGKTFKCKVLTFDKVDTGSPNGGEGHAKIWVSSDVPGGIVKMEANGGRPGPDKKIPTVTFLLTDYEAK